MDAQTYQREIIRAETMALADPGNAHYWHGYLRGLRRAHFGERFGTQAEHEFWMTLIDSPEPLGAARGRGYRDALAFGAVIIA